MRTHAYSEEKTYSLNITIPIPPIRRRIPYHSYGDKLFRKVGWKADERRGLLDQTGDDLSPGLVRCWTPTAGCGEGWVSNRLSVAQAVATGQVRFFRYTECNRLWEGYAKSKYGSPGLSRTVTVICLYENFNYMHYPRRGNKIWKMSFNWI